jgi:hypothetical protein
MEESIIQFLKANNWNLDKAPNGLYHTRYQGKNTELIVHLNIMNLELSILLAIAYLPVKIKSHQINEVARFLNALNLKTFFGSFELDYDIGEIAFRTGIYFFNTDFQMPMAINCLRAAAYFADVHYPSILEAMSDLQS